MAKRNRKLTRGTKIGLEVLDGIRELKAGGGVVYRVEKKKPGKTVLGRTRAA